ncbi:hypothetical protein GQ53DRAFT_758658 [Thozetella sp. PMI_491]|nr:hypothetical protein GQ53DRAFT_758658 [Thozetella sp. PMI_491]
MALSCPAHRNCSEACTALLAPSRRQAHPAGPMYVAPKVEYQFPPDLMVKVRPETLNTIVTHLNWSSWVKSRQPRSRWLPPEVISRLIRYLDYTRLVRLSSVNKDLFYNDELKTTIENRPEIEKSGCVALAEKLFKQHFPGKKGKDPCPGNLGCYYCFKVLPYDRFEHLSWNIAPKNPKSEHDDLDEENEAGFHTPSPLPKHRQASVASVTSSFPSSSLLLESTSPTMTGITKSSRQSSVALSSPLSSSYDSPRHSTTSSPPIGKLQTPAPYGPSASMASPPDVCLETAKKSSKAGKKRSRPITDDEEAHYALQRVKKHQEKRRFCIECGAKNRFYEPGDLIQPNSVDNGKAKTQHNTLWICGCYRLHSQLTYPTCYDCGRSARYSYAK